MAQSFDLIIHDGTASRLRAGVVGRRAKLGCGCHRIRNLPKYTIGDAPVQTLVLAMLNHVHEGHLTL